MKYLAVFLAVGFGSAHAQEAMFRNNLSHTGVVDQKPLTSPAGIRWLLKTDGAVRGTPTVADGVVYIGSGDGWCYAVAASTGEVRWKFKTGGAVQSTATVWNDLVFFTSRDNVVYALQRASGAVVWTYPMGKTLPYQWEFDYWLSSVSVSGSIAFVGGGDGFLHALDARSGKVRWKFDAGARVRSTPAVAHGVVFFGNMTGWLFALDEKTGQLRWKFGTEGTRIKTSEWGFDRNSILSSPAVAEGFVVFGGRDGFLYAVDEKTGEEKWRFDHNISWITGSPAVHQSTVYSGTSDGKFVQAVDLKTGKEKWRFTTPGIVWSSPMLCGPMVSFIDNIGNVFTLDAATGEERWRYTVPGRSFSSPVIHDGAMFFGCDDGYVIALDGRTEAEPRVKPRKAVFWEASGPYNYFKFDIDKSIRDYFQREGYEVLDAAQLAAFMQDGIAKKAPSVVVFAAHRVPASVFGDTTARAPIRKYLDAGGKVMFLAPNPMAFKRDSLDRLVEISFVYPEKVLGIKYQGNDIDGFVGFYYASPTKDGIRWGLRNPWVGSTAVHPNQVMTVLAVDENGLAAGWVKNYGGPPGTGLVQLWIPQDVFPDFVTLKNAAEYGLN